MTTKKILIGDSKDILLWNIFAVTVVQKNAEESFASKSFIAFKKILTLSSYLQRDKSNSQQIQYNELMKTIVITGASRGIGLATATRFLIDALVNNAAITLDFMI